MSFLAPLFLLGGLALAAPILFHLVRRTTRERTIFSSLMFLMPTPPRLSRRSRLENLLLLLLRCLALALLVLGFARPFLKHAPIHDPTVAQPKRIVVLVDTSASMRRAGLWTAARERVDAVLRQAGPADQVAVFTFDRQARPLVPFEDWNQAAPTDRVAMTSGRLGGAEPGWAGTQLGSALITAAEALAETDSAVTSGPRQIILISDLQTGSRIDALQAYEWPKGVTLRIEDIAAENVTNAGLQLVADAVDTTRAPDAPLRVRVTNSANAKAEQFTVGWQAPNGAGELLGTPISIYVPPGQSRIVALPPLKDTPGLERIGLRGDDDDFDNTVFVIPPTQQRVGVLWLGTETVDDTRQPLFFLRRAFSDTPGLAINVTVRGPQAVLTPGDVEGGVIFVSGTVPPAQATIVREQALAGKTVVFLAKNAGAAPTLAALLGRENLAMEEARVTNYAMLAEIDFKHPIFAPLADPRFSDFTKIHFWKYRKLDPTVITDGRVLARFDSGDPALLEAPVGKGRLVVLTASWHPDDSQLAVSSKFVPLAWSLLELGGGVPSAPGQWAVGDAVPVPVALGTAVSVRSPGQTAESAAVALPAQAIRFSETMRPGIYELAGAERKQRFAVNLEANESRTAPLAPDELERLGVALAAAEADPAVVPKAEEERLLQGVEAENRQKLWRWLITATLAVLLMESAVAGWTARRGAVQPQEIPAS